MDQVDALQLYFEGEAAHKAGRNDQCLEMWDRVLQFLADHGLHALETDMATLPRAMLAMNLAIVCQKAKRYADMHRYAAHLVELDRSAGSLRLLATALKNDGEPAKARQIIDEAVQLDPHHANSHWERACILAAEGDLRGAIDAVRLSVENGADPSGTLADDELAVLQGVPGFDDALRPAAQRTYDQKSNVAEAHFDWNID